MTAFSSAAFADWVAQARAVPIEEALAGRAVRLKRSGAESIGPCPVCGGRDRFALHHRKQLFLCRGSGTGGDVIALIRYLEGCEFKVACEILTRRPAPGSDAAETPEERQKREAALAKRAARQARVSAQKDAESARFRERERRVCWEAWVGAGPLPGSPGEAAAQAYFARRGLILPERAALRCAPDHPYFAHGRQGAEIVHRGPALLAAIVGPNRRFSGLHATWLDSSQPSGKASLADPETGEILPAKKVRGSATGGHIRLVPQEAADILVIGEGLETVLSVWRALAETGRADLARMAFWAAYSLGNLAGPATGTVAHPSARDRGGRPRRVPSAVPDLMRPGLPIPDGLKRVHLLGDGDSDRFTTQAALTRAARRFRAANPALEIRVSWAPDGQDFNDLLMGAAA